MLNNSSSLNSSSVNELNNTVITVSKIDTNVMAAIENLPNSINYTLYLKSLFSYLEINESTISYVSFKNKRAILYFSNMYAFNNFLSTRSMLKSTKFSFLFFRTYISDEEFKKGRIFYHAIKSKLITVFKSICNHRSTTYHLYRTYITDGNVVIDWENSRSVSDAEMKEWSDSFLAYSNSKKESSSISQH